MHLTPNPGASGGAVTPGTPDPDSIDLTCPSCGTDLMADDAFRAHRVCGGCGRHFAIGARERIGLLVDTGVFEEFDVSASLPADAASRDQLPSAERLAEHQHLQGIGEAVVTGYGSIGGAYAVVIALDDHLVGHALGVLMSGKVLHAFEYARSQKLPVVLLVAGGVASVPAGPLSLAQGSRLATAAAQLHLDGVPVLGVLTHPMSSGVYAALAAHCDVLLSEPGVVVHARGAGGAPRAEPWTAETLLARGWIDGLVRRDELSSQVGLFLDLVSAVGLVRPDAIVPREAAAFALPDALARLRQEGRPGVAECLAHLVPSAVPLRGDRVNDDHPGVLCGIGRLDGMSIAYAGVTREARALPAGGAAARKIGRIARLAGRFELPLLLLVDGAVGAPEPPFEPDAANAEAALAATLAVLPVPVIAVGLGCMSGSLATLMMNGDRQYLMSSAVCTPPPDNASGWQPGRPASGRVAALTARECERLGLVDGVIAEPPAGAHADPDGMLIALRATVVQALAELAGTGPRRLLDTRVLRQRTLGQSTPEGLAEARSELWALQDWQRTVERNVERSLDEWRGRWEQLKASQPRITFQRPDIADLAARVRARRTELLERAGLGDRSHD